METTRTLERRGLLTEEEMNRICDEGELIYEERLKASLEPDHDGKVVAIHLASGNYEVGRTSSEAGRALRMRCPDGPYYYRDIGIAPWDELSMRMAATHPAKHRER